MRVGHDRESMPFADWLDGRLRTARISQRQLAMRAGVHHSTISRLVRQRRTPSFDTAVRLAQVLDPTGTLPIARPRDARSTSPPMRVEYALRSDPSLGAGDVRELMRGYLRLRARRHAVASCSRGPARGAAPRGSESGVKRRSDRAKWRGCDAPCNMNARAAAAAVMSAGLRCLRSPSGRRSGARRHEGIRHP